MSKSRSLSKQLLGTGFFEELFGMIIDRGFGVLPAREMAIETLGLMLKHHPEWSGKTPSAYELARILRSSPRKIRGYLDEISYRDPRLDESSLNQELRQVLLSGERLRDGAFVAIEIDDGLVRAHARQLVRENLGIAEQGNSQSILKLSGRQYATLCASILPEKDVASLLNAFENEWPDTSDSTQKPKSLASCLVERFALAASHQAGRKSIDLGFTLLSAGLSDLPGVIQSLRKLLEGS
jgi:hypothetical protein